jgi:DNA-binding transcriptional LysR family regulator
MEIKTLKSFVAVATLKNFSAAARELNTVQPAISRHITDLEEELGVKLFWRNTREVKISPAGESLLHDAKAILANETEAIKRAQLANQGKTGRLSIGYLGPACFAFIPKLVQTYVHRYPEVEIQLKEMTVRQQLEAFDREELDIGFSRNLPSAYRKDFAVEDIYTDTLMAVLPDSHPLADSKDSISLRLKQLDTESFILFSRHEAPGLFDQIISVFQKDGIVPMISSQPEYMQVVLTNVAAGLGVSVLPACIRNMYSNGCTFVPIHGQIPSIATQLHYRPNPLLSTVKAFVEITLENRSEIKKQMERGVKRQHFDNKRFSAQISPETTTIPFQKHSGTN